MRAALDTNLLVYAEGFGDDARVSRTRQLLDQLSEADLVIPLQCLGELFRVLTGKAGRPALQAREAVLGWMDAFAVLESTPAAWRGAMDLCVAHQLASWDALVLNGAAEGGARLLLHRSRPSEMAGRVFRSCRWACDSADCAGIMYR
jgi:predicted nucleic acid-binding protein